MQYLLQAGLSGVLLTFNLSAEIRNVLLGYVTLADTRKFGEIVRNLVTHAVSSTPAGGRVDVTVEPYLDPFAADLLGSHSSPSVGVGVNVSGLASSLTVSPVPRLNMLRVRVVDTGVGISEVQYSTVQYSRL